VAVALVAGWIFGINPLTMLGLLSGSPDTGVPSAQAPASAPPAGDRQAAFVSTVLGITEDVWVQLFQQSGARYEQPRLVLFRGVTPTACGTGQSAMGPFYCPGDHKVYIDLAFYDTLQRQIGAPGDFARPTSSHEVGHHVQNLMGITGQVEQRRSGWRAQMNALSVRVELQADCFAGSGPTMPTRRADPESGDVEEALNAASRIGDDALQHQSQGRVVPESFTHGTSAQRVGWFRRGLQSGSVGDCDTFKARQL
jgi:predicted metalloprotease